MSAPDFISIVTGLDAKKSGEQYAAKCPAHSDSHASLSLGKPNGKIVFKCHAGCTQNEIILALRERGLWPNESSKQGKQIVATYDYVDENGVLIFQAVRYQPKDFRQRRPDGKGDKWTWNLNGINRVLFNLPAVRAAIKAGEFVVVVEGEKDVLTLVKIGITATTNAGGAGKWRKEYSVCLKGAHVVILPDNDEPGRKHAEQIVASLNGIAAQARIIELPGLPPKGDVSDWLAAGGTRDELLLMIGANNTPETGNRSHAATEIDGAALLDSVHAFLGRFVAYPSDGAHVAHTLWIAHTHLMDKWESTPRIAFLSPEPGSGKTRALEITETLVPRPVEAINATPAYLFRKVSDPDGAPSILYDEIDTLFGPKAKDNEEIRGILNAGHRRGAMAGRCVVRGKIIETEELPAYCAVALAGLGNLPDTILSRSVVIRMRRRAPTESVEPYRRRIHGIEGNALRDQIKAWALQQPNIGKAWPAMPSGIEDRNADVWEALLAVADAAGGTWPERARVTAVTLVTESMAGSPSLGIRLLADLRQVFGECEAMFTRDIIKALCDMEEAPWADMKGKPIDARRLSRYLDTYGVARKLLRIGEQVGKGYTREALHDPWARYLGPTLGLPAYVSVTSVTSDTTCPRCDGDGCQWCGGAGKTS